MSTLALPVVAPTPSSETCPLCQARVDPACANCASSCPAAASCGVTTCPSCGYRFPRPTGFSRLLQRWFTRRKVRVEDLPAVELTLDRAGAGQRLRVLSLSRAAHDRLSKLAAFGIVEGCELRLRQKHPALVIEIGETTLALDGAIASEVVVCALADD